ncbi:MAG: group II truncated hemoglobin [Polaromonas sp.]|uniref:group II truncated hemoglobin n=1 Tax=Polaromonas sp. TaxID=1869339 RepID=UPI0017DDC888|nr:group II truncated hemoglobin [Polaromonas sp.]NMM11193.1 group II truncated hemoglobin [Polaromonas sp.]
MTTETMITPYQALGGAAGVQQLVLRFYELMDELPEAYAVRRLHPESLKGSAENLFDYLSGWFGGPSLYIQKKGHPRLRMRHNPYAVGPVVRDEWMLCMKQALSEQVADEVFRAQLIDTFTQMADHMVNTQGAGPCPAGEAA